MNRAMGMVMAREKVPQGESARAFTTTRASTASRMMMIAHTATRRAAPPNGQTSSRARRQMWGADDPPRVWRLKVLVVVEPFGRGGPGVVDPEDPVGDEPGVEPVGDRVRAQCGHDQPDRVDRLAPGQGEDPPGDRPQHG